MVSLKKENFFSLMVTLAFLNSKSAASMCFECYYVVYKKILVSSLKKTAFCHFADVSMPSITCWNVVVAIFDPNYVAKNFGAL